MTVDEAGNSVGFNANGSGMAQVEGDVLFKGFDVIMAGLYLATKNLVSASDADSFTYYGTAQDDQVDLTLTNIAETADVDLGDGDDRLDLTINQNPTVDISATADLVTALSDVTTLDPGASPAELLGQVNQLGSTINGAVSGEVSAPKTVKVNVRGGKGNDEIAVTQVNSTDVDISGSSGARIAIDIGRTELNVDGGDGNDEILSSGGMSMAAGRMLVKAIADFVKEKVTAAAAFMGRNTLTGGAGDDVITVDTTTGFANHFGINTTVNGGAGFDRLHLTGKLDTNVPELNRIAGTGSHLDLKTLAEIQFQTALGDKTVSSISDEMGVDISGTEAYTDTLLNKKQVSVTNGGGIIPADSFTNYVLAVTGGQPAGYSFGGGAGNLFLSNLVIKSNGKLTVGNVNAGSLNLIMEAPQIDLTGIISARNILALSEVTDEKLVGAQIIGVEDDLSAEDAADGLSPLNIDLSLYNATADAKIHVAETARLTASEAAVLIASIAQSKPYFPAVDELNFITVKKGSAVMDILGSITAGGSITAKTIAKAEIDISIDEASLLKIIPFSVAAADITSSLTVGGNAVINAGASVNLMARTRVSLNAYNVAATPKIPIAISGGIAIAKTELKVAGNSRIVSGADMLLTADSRVQSSTASIAKTADKLATKPSLAAIYLGFNVVLADTSVKVMEQASLNAGGALLAKSRSILRADTAAVSLPANTSGKYGKTSALNIIEKVLGVTASANQSTFGGILSAATGSNILGNHFTDATKSASNGSTKQIVGAIAAAYIDHKNEAVLSTAGSILAKGLVGVDANAQTVSYLRADGSLYRTPAIATLPGSGDITPVTEPDNAVGGGIGITVFFHKNRAAIEMQARRN
jgi:hypothetical protein